MHIHVQMRRTMSLALWKAKYRVKTTPFPTVQWMYLVCCHVTAAAGLAGAAPDTWHGDREAGCR